MKNAVSVVTLAVITMLTGNSLAQTGDKATALAAVSKLYQQHYAAAERQDWARYFEIYDSGYVSVGLDGKRTSRAEIQANFQQFLPRLREFKELLLDIEATDLKGQQLVLRVHDIDRRTWTNSRAPNGLEIITTNVRSEETWQRNPEGWKLISSRLMTAKAEGRLPEPTDVIKMDPRKMTPEQRQLWLMVMKQKQENVNMAIHGQACTLGYGYNCRGW